MTQETEEVIGFEGEIPWYYNDGGQVFWVFGNQLFSAPISADNSILWRDAYEVEFHMIDPELVTYGRAVHKALDDLMAATSELRGL